MNEITTIQLVAWMRRFTVQIETHKDQLTELDAAIGDADHGANLQRGMEAVCLKLDESVNPSDLFKIIAMTLVSQVGGASGALYGSFFLAASQATKDLPQLSTAQLVEMFEKGLHGILHRGKAELGDKTMIDTLQPAIESLSQAQDQGLAVAWQAALTAGEQGREATINMIARKGRASYLGERSAGHPDPGATSALYLLQAAAETLV